MERDVMGFGHGQAQNNYAGMQNTLAPPPQPSVGRTLDNTIEMLQRAAQTARQIDGQLNGFQPEEVAKGSGGAQALSIHERANTTENIASNLSALLESILGRL